LTSQKTIFKPRTIDVGDGDDEDSEFSENAFGDEADLDNYFHFDVDAYRRERMNADLQRQLEGGDGLSMHTELSQLSVIMQSTSFASGSSTSVIHPLDLDYDGACGDGPDVPVLPISDDE